MPEGADIELDVQLEAVMEGVLATGTASATYSGECSRCLDAVHAHTEATFTELFFYPGESAGESEDESRLEGDFLDLEPIVHDAIVLTLPQSALCREDCPGLCPVCGEKLSEPGEQHEHARSVDPRWSALRGLTHSPNDDQEG